LKAMGPPNYRLEIPKLWVKKLVLFLIWLSQVFNISPEKWPKCLISKKVCDFFKECNYKNYMNF
jgi:hypothetical protein